jgi:hypothetical protein
MAKRRHISAAAKGHHQNYAVHIGNLRCSTRDAKTRAYLHANVEPVKVELEAPMEISFVGVEMGPR